MLYFFAPLASEWSTFTGREDRDPFDYIPWPLVELAGREYSVPLEYGPGQRMVPHAMDAIVLDRHAEFTRRYYIESVRSDLSPLSKPQTDSVSAQQR